MAHNLDVVILSHAKTERLKNLTTQTVTSLLLHTRPNKVIVMEQQNGVSYPMTETIHISEKFNYNRFANIGASKGTSDWICIANNDLIFHEGWFDQMPLSCASVISPKEPTDKRQAHIFKNESGYDCAVHFSGWCFVISRLVWNAIGGFDEDFDFWCADNSVIEQVNKIGVIPVIVPESKVTHIGSQTLRTINEKDPLTRQAVLRFNKKYNQNLFGWGTI